MNDKIDKAPDTGGDSMRATIREVIGEYVELQRSKAEPAYKAELADERRRREQLELRLNNLAEENRRARERADEAERTSAIRGELQRLGVQKLDLAFRAVKDDVARSEDGRLVARDGGTEVGLREYLSRFVQENPELLPARNTGGSGAALHRNAPAPARAPVDLDRIKPGMDPAELDRVRQEIAEVAMNALRGNRE